MANGLATAEACHWQQTQDIESVFSSLTSNKTEQPDMERIISVLPYAEAHEDAKEQIDVYTALANPEATGEEQCKRALAVLKVNTTKS
jgi:acetolactate synthase small subunit